MKTTCVKSVFLSVVLVATSMIAFSQTEQEIKMKIEKMNKKLTEAMLSGDMEKSLSFYASDAVSLPSYGPMAEGIDAIRKSSEEMMNSGMKITACSFETKKVKVCDKMITEIGLYKMSMSMPEMEGAMEDHGKYLTIWEMQADGSLKIKVEMWNTDVMPKM